MWTASDANAAVYLWTVRQGMSLGSQCVDEACVKVLLSVKPRVWHSCILAGSLRLELLNGLLRCCSKGDECGVSRHY